MNLFNYIAVTFLSLFSTIVLVCMIRDSDRKQREPAYMIILSLISCLFTICVSLLLGQIILPKLDIISSGLFNFDTQNILKIVLLALVEEYSKLLVLYLCISRNKNFDDIFDGFVYSSLIALSFAAFETLLYVFNESTLSSMQSLAVLRGVTTVPLHLFCGIVMGYYMGVEKFSWGTKRRIITLMKCLLVPTFIHFAYNYILSCVITNVAIDSFVIIILVVIFVIFYFTSMFIIKRLKFLNEQFLSNVKYKNLMTKKEYDDIVNNKIN